MVVDNSIHRERFAAALARKAADRPPMDLDSTDMTGIEGGPRRLAPLLGVAEDDEAVLVALDTDIRDVGGIFAPPGELARQVSDTYFTDCWGIGYEFNGHHHEMVGRPLAGAGIEDLESYDWPQPERLDPAVFEQLAAEARDLRENSPYVVCARHPYYGVMELGCWMCGFDDFLYRMAGEPEFVHRFFEIILDYQKKIDARYYAAVGPYCHFTTSGDDFGTQTGPFLSTAMFRDLVVPFLAERIRHIRTYTDGAFFHHTCGSVFDLIPDLISAGVDILNPIQPRAKDMEPTKLKAAYGDRLTFYGGVDTQQLLPHGTPEEVAAETHGLIRTLAPGYVLSAAHTILEEVPLENVVAMYRAGAAV
jgi:uroporphyrinogen decarboxylase